MLQKIKLRNAQIHELQLKHDSLLGENANIVNQMREEERVLALEKEKLFGM